MSAVEFALGARDVKFKSRPNSPGRGLTGKKLPSVTEPPLLTVVLTTMLLKVNPSTLHEKPDAVYVLTGATAQAALHAGDPIRGVRISAAAKPTSDETFSIVASLIYDFRGCAHSDFATNLVGGATSSDTF